MKKTKKIVSTILGLLSAFSFKSSAMDFDIDDDEDGFTYDIDGEFDNQKGISLGTKTLIGGIMGCGALSLLICYNTNFLSVERKLISKYGDQYLEEYKNNKDVKALKDEMNRKHSDFFLTECNDKIIKRICCYYVFAMMLNSMAQNRKWNPGDFEANLVVMKAMAGCAGVQYSEEATREYRILVVVAVIRSLFEEGILKVYNGNVTINNPNFGNIINACLDYLKTYLTTLKDKIEKKESNKITEKLKNAYSLMACCLGADLWKKLYPDKEYDEQEYLRLQEQLSV